jgi:valyl-tRNA synthetase
VKLDPARVAGYRNFGTKLWNAARFAQMNGAAAGTGFDPTSTTHTINRWILTELSRSIGDVTAGIEKYRFNEAAGAAYKFVWHTFCDWYLELLKPLFSGTDEEAKSESLACAAYVIEQICKLLHPFMPFITEELWEQMVSDDVTRESLLCHAEWPQHDLEDDDAAAEINWLIELVSEIRSVRAEMNIKPSQIMPLALVDANEATRTRIAIHAPAIQRLARVDPVEIAAHAPQGAAQIVIGEATACLPLAGIVDFDAERSRLQKEVKRLEAEIKRLDGKLSNEKFVANAPDEVVEAEREKLAEYRVQLDRTKSAAKRIASG